MNYRGFVKLTVKAIKFFLDLNRNYMIWVYHIFFNMILVNEHKDLLSTVLFTSETLCIFIHLILFKRNDRKATVWIYWTWYASFMLVMVYAIVRYTLFFLKYSTFNYYLN